MSLSKSFLERVLAAKWHLRREGDRETRDWKGLEEGPDRRHKIKRFNRVAASTNRVDEIRRKRLRYIPRRINYASSIPPLSTNVVSLDVDSSECLVASYNHVPPVLTLGRRLLHGKDRTDHL